MNFPPASRDFRKLFRSAAFLLVSAFAAYPSVHAAELRQPIVFNENGGWCWFQDERAIIDRGKLLFGSVTSNLEKSDPGDIVATTYDFQTGEISTAMLHPGLERDDHNAPAFLIRPDGRYLAVYTGHNLDPWVRYRISKHPGQTAEWGAEHAVWTGGTITYSNVYRLSAENRTYNFHRNGQRTPAFLTSEDDGATWSESRQFLKSDRRTWWPYIRYASNNVDEIHFIVTDSHPNQYDSTNLYHGFVRDGKIHRSDGTIAGDLPTGEFSSVSPADLTLIFEGNPGNIPWSSSIEIDSDGNPRIAYSVTVDDGKGFDNRYRYAHFDGEKWHDREIAFAGSMLYAQQNFYTGLTAIHPAKPDQVFISTNADPKTGAPLISEADGKRHWEIFAGAPSEHGDWHWTPLTQNSTEDNIRPLIATDGQHEALLWMRGTYTEYRVYACQIVGFAGPAGEAIPAP